MSSDLAPAPHAVMDEPHNVDDEAYEPTYAEAFPPLPVPVVDREPAPPTTQNAWGSNKLSVRRSNVTQAFNVPLEERRFKEVEQGFGGEQLEQASICQNIMQRTGVSIEVCSAKDKSLTILITGKSDKVMLARKMVVQQLQTQARQWISIPKEHHRFLLGAKGVKLADLELNTATKITIPRSEENSDMVTIVGTKEGIERAKHEIQLISDEQAKLAFERLKILKIYHPFICGPDNQLVKTLSDHTGARINVPPPSVQKDEIVVSGEKDGVRLAIEQIMKIYDEKRAKCQTVSVEVHKSQHKYVIGPRGANLNEILSETGVSVEVPPLDNMSETITLRGEQDKLGSALTMVYSKANSVVIGEVEAPAWLHRFIIGRKGSNINKVTEEHPKVHISFVDSTNKIELEGPPEDVAAAKQTLQSMTKDFLSRMDYAEIKVEPKYHKHIIGRQGANVSRIKEETGVSIRIPQDSENSNVIRIEGSPEGVNHAKKELLDMVQKMENEKSRDILIEQRFHKTIIGPQGGKIREIRDRFNQVQITFPDPAKRTDVVTLRGPKNDVDKGFRYLQQLQQELITSNYAAEVRIFKQFHKNIIGKGGATIKKIRDETDTKIDLPSEANESDVITITGKRENVEQAKVKIESIQKELTNIKEVTLEIPNKFHNSIIGAKGRLIRSVMEECGGVIIRFPPEGSASDKVVIRGPKDDVEKARNQLLELANERKESGFTVELRAKPEYHKFLIGRGGANIRNIRENIGARVIFPTAKDPDPELITIMGKKDAIEEAKKELEGRIRNLDNIVEAQINVDPKHHRHFVIRRGEVLRQVADDYGGVSVSFPRSGVKSDVVTLKGAKECVEGAKKRILEIVADLDAQVTMECVIPQQYHRTVMGPKGTRVQEITKDYDVGIKFPDRPTEEQLHDNGPEQALNGEVNSESSNEGGEKSHAPHKWDIIIITGRKENCEGAKEALLALVPIIKEVVVPMDFHRYIIGKRGGEVRQMMDTYEVNISIPSPDKNSDVISVTGPPAHVARAEQGLLEKVRQLEAEKEERLARSFKIEVKVDPHYHPKIIGRKGAVISRIRTDNNVQIQFPERGSENEDAIVITGYEADAEAARDDILRIVQELEDQMSEEVSIDHRVHPRIIGQRGRNVRKIMDQYKVDIKFPRSDSDNPDVVIISGSEENVLDCKEHLLDMEEEFLQDILDKELLNQYYHPRSQSEEGAKPSDRGFTVRDAPWTQPGGAGGGGDPSDGGVKAASGPPPHHGARPHTGGRGRGGTIDTTSTADFPEFGATVSKSPIVWGPPRKH